MNDPKSGIDKDEGKISVLAHTIVFKIMQTNPYTDPNLLYETACINKYAPIRKLSQDEFELR